MPKATPQQQAWMDGYDAAMAVKQHPKIEVLVVRDPDMENDIRVFVDGEESTDVSVFDVDAGHGYTAADWVTDEYRETQNRGDITEAFRTALLAAVSDPPGREYIEGWDDDETIEELATRVDAEEAQL